MILVAIFTCFMFLFMFDVRLSYHYKRLLTYFTYLYHTFLIFFTQSSQVTSLAN